MLALIIDEIIRTEGGYVDDPVDRGGPTKYGITIQTLAQWRGREVTVEDVKELTREEAARIYEELYVRRPNFDKLPEELQPIVVDCGVLMGTATAARILQEALCELGCECAVDGKVGRKTVEAARRAPLRDLINLIVGKRIERHRELVRRDPRQKRFLRGWVRRAEKFRQEGGHDVA